MWVKEKGELFHMIGYLFNERKTTVVARFSSSWFPNFQWKLKKIYIYINWENLHTQKQPKINLHTLENAFTTEKKPKITLWKVHIWD